MLDDAHDQGRDEQRGSYRCDAPRACLQTIEQRLGIDARMRAKPRQHDRRHHADISRKERRITISQQNHDDNQYQQHVDIEPDRPPRGCHHIGSHGRQIAPLCFQGDHEIDGEEVKEGRQRRPQRNIRIFGVGEVSDEKGRRAHDRRHQLPASRCHRLHGGRELAPEAGTDHQRNGERARRIDIRRSGAGDGTKQSTCQHRGLGRPALDLAHDSNRDVHEQLTAAGLLQHSAK